MINKIILAILVFNLYTACQAWQFDFNLALPKFKPPSDAQIEHNKQKQLEQVNNGIIFNKDIIRKQNETRVTSNRNIFSTLK